MTSKEIAAELTVILADYDAGIEEALARPDEAVRHHRQILAGTHLRNALERALTDICADISQQDHNARERDEPYHADTLFRPDNQPSTVQDWPAPGGYGQLAAVPGLDRSLDQRNADAD